MPPTILAATDLSAPARHAAVRAALLAAETGSTLELLHVIETGPLDELRRLFADEAGELVARLKAQTGEAMRHLAAEMGGPAGTGPGVTIAEGMVLAEIATRADALGADLVVLGAHGANLVSHWLLGATASRLLRKVRHPVLVVRLLPRERYRSVLVPVDFSPWSLAAVALARKFAPAAELTLLHVYQVPFEANLRLAGVEEESIQSHRMAARRAAHDRLHDLAARAGLEAGRYRAVVVHGDAAPRILEQEEEQDADLIVMGKQGEGALEELLLGSVTKHVLNETRRDLLVARLPE